MAKGSVPYGVRGVPNGSSSYSGTGDGMGSEYVESLASFKRHAVTATGGRVNLLNKSRQQVPPDGSSSLNPPRSPRFNDRYRQNIPGGNNTASTAVDHNSDWYDDSKDEERPESGGSSRSGYSRGSGRGSGRSGYSGTSWSSRKSRSPATELWAASHSSVILKLINSRLTTLIILLPTAINYLKKTHVTLINIITPIFIFPLILTHINQTFLKLCPLFMFKRTPGGMCTRVMTQSITHSFPFHPWKLSCEVIMGLKLMSGASSPSVQIYCSFCFDSRVMNGCMLYI